jgi:uncharacterized protein (UPF0332 family)
MPYERLINQNRIVPFKATTAQVNQLLQVAERDLKAAQRNLDVDADWAYTMAYNAVLQACRAVVFSESFRPLGGEQHVTVVEFASEKFGEEFKKEIQLFDQMRRKRHWIIYETAGLVSIEEAKQAVTFANRFVFEINNKITGKNHLF